MARYCVNTQAQTNGDHEVHVQFCNFLPQPEHQKWLGNFATCVDAVKEAKRTYPQSNGCFYCSSACHTT